MTRDLTSPNGITSLLTGKARTVHPILWIVAAAFVLYFAIGPITDALA